MARLDRPQKLRGVRVWWMSFYGLPQAVKLQLWRDGAWHDAPGFENWRAARSAVEDLALPQAAVDRVRVVQRAGGGNSTCPNLMGASEIMLLPSAGEGEAAGRGGAQK